MEVGHALDEGLMTQGLFLQMWARQVTGHDRAWVRVLTEAREGEIRRAA